MKDEESHKRECAHTHVDNGNHSSFSCSVLSMYNDWWDSHSILPKECIGQLRLSHRVLGYTVDRLSSRRCSEQPWFPNGVC